MLIIDVLLLVAALIICIAALVRNSIQYCYVALLLVIVNLLIHVIPK